MQSTTFLFAAYTIVWVCLAIFLLRLALKLATMEKEFKRLQNK